MRSPSCPGGIAEAGRAIFSRAPPQLGGFDEGQWVWRRAALARLVLGARKSPCGRSAAPLKTPRESGLTFGKVLGSARRRHFLSSRPRLVPCSREDGARFAQAPPLPPAVHPLGKPGLNINCKLKLKDGTHGLAQMAELFSPPCPQTRSLAVVY